MVFICVGIVKKFNLSRCNASYYCGLNAGRVNVMFSKDCLIRRDLAKTNMLDDKYQLRRLLTGFRVVHEIPVK